jgi:KaiC/GvpD/RAD55 family RecA-like ATPase
MKKITDYLTLREGISELRMYTICGRRGVGKTEIALQYAYDNPSRFDAIFWI